MNRALTFGFVLVVFCVIFNSCKKDSHTDCPGPIYFTFSHSDSTRSPYTGKETLKFLYRDSQKKDTFIFKSKSVKNDTVYSGSQPISEGCNQDQYSQRHQFIYSNSKHTDSRYQLVITYTASAGEANLAIQYDSIHINSNLLGLDNPSWGHYHSSMTFEGMTFYVVNDKEEGIPPRFFTIYYTSLNGIVRMEYKSGISLTLLP